MANGNTQIFLGARVLNNVEQFYEHQMKSGAVSKKEHDAIVALIQRKDTQNGLLVELKPVKEIRAKEYMSRSAKVSEQTTLPEGISEKDMKLFKAFMAAVKTQ